MKYIFGLDLSMKCTGIAIFDEEGNPVMNCSIMTNDKQTHGKRLKVIADRMKELIELYPPKIISIERGFSRFNVATAVIYRVHGVVNYILNEFIQVYYPPKEVKKFILKGTATKKQVQETILKKYPNIKFANEDESDAFAVGLTYFIKNNKIKWKE